MESSINAPAKNGANHGANPAVQAPVVEDIPPAAAARFSHYRVVRRSGAAVPFDLQKITAAMMKAFLAVEGASAAGSARVREIVDNAAAAVVAGLTRRDPLAGVFHIEDVQDQVELALMRGGCHEVARSYILYREARAETRRQSARELLSGELNIVAADGRSRPLEVLDLRRRIKAACDGIEAVDAEAVLRASVQELFDGASEDDMRQAPILAARALIEREPNYSFVAARLLLAKLQSEALGADVSPPQMAQLYPRHLSQMLRAGIDAELLHPDMGKKFDRKKLGAAIDSKRDLAFGYLGLQTLYDRYFLRAPADGRRLELPQSFFMRVAMGLALNEDDPTARAIEFYRLLSSFDFMSSTPTLFNSGGLHSQLSSCYLTTVGDDLADIFEAYRENALLAKFAGGLGNDWTPVRAMGARIKGTNGRSQGVIPFLKIVNDTAVAVNQGGKRKGACCVYLETWHLDIEEFLELRKNTGDERRRAHDTNTANWIPDLFMKRVAAAAEWTLFSPDEVPDLHDKSGRAFEAAYERCEARARAGEIRSKTVRAVDLWRRMLTMLFETGHPWLAFKDPCNIRSPQNHAGVVHSSNLCTEITLNTGPDEIAVCNLGSVNLHAHIKDGALDEDKLRRTVKTAMRMLDNVIDLNYYAVDKARQANMRHRPVGLGMMGFQDCLYELGVSYDSEAAADFADRSTEALCYFAYWASTELAAERGAYSSFAGSLWSRGILPRDSLRLLARERGGAGAETVDGGSGDLLPVRRGRGFAHRASRNRHLGDERLGRVARAHRSLRHAQLQLRGDCADGDDRQHRRRLGEHRADLPKHFRQIESVGRFHRRQPPSRGRAQRSRDLGRSDARRHQILRRPPLADRSRAGRNQAPLSDSFRNRSQAADRLRGAAAKMDRSSAIAQSLCRRAVGAQTGRNVSPRVAARPQNNILSALAGGVLHREIHDARGRPERRRRRGVRDRRPGLRGLPIGGWAAVGFWPATTCRICGG